MNHLKFQRGLRSTAEERVGKRCANLRVLNSYWINQDGVYKYYEVILVDPNHKALSVVLSFFMRLFMAIQIRRDPKINWITAPVHKRREARGLTSIGKQVCCIHSLFLLYQTNKIYRTVVLAKDTGTTTRLVWLPGKSTTPSAFVATGDRVHPSPFMYSFLYPPVIHGISMLLMHVCRASELTPIAALAFMLRPLL